MLLSLKAIPRYIDTLTDLFRKNTITETLSTDLSMDDPPDAFPIHPPHEGGADEATMTDLLGKATITETPSTALCKDAPPDTLSVHSLHEGHDKALPAEIWADIFELCLPDSSPTTIASQTVFPWMLSHVCREWRTIVFGTGALWSKITFDCGLYAQSDSARTITHNQRLLSQLENTKQCPLDITVFNFSTRVNLEPDSLCLLWLTILPYLPRSRNLYVHDTSRHLFRSARSSFPTSTVFPFLRRLAWKLDTHSWLDESETPFDFNFCWRTPQLRHVHLIGNPGRCTKYITFEQLTFVQLTQMQRHSDIAEIIAHLSNTEVLELKELRKRSEFDDLEEPAGIQLQCTLPKLRTMIVGTGSDLEALHADIAACSAPNLQTLRVKLLHLSEMEWVLTFLLTTSCNLTAFIVENSPHISASALFSFLRNFPTLTLVDVHLNSCNIELAYTLINMLSRNTPGPYSALICPSLQHLRLTADDGSVIAVSYDPTPLMKMIRERKTSGFRQVEIGLSRNLVNAEEGWCKVDELLDEGIAIKFVPFSTRYPHSGNTYSFSTFCDIAMDAQLLALRITSI